MTQDSSNTPSADARSRLLRAGCELFAEKGLEGTTTREIAQRAGLNVSLISYYFEGKEGLYRTTLEEHARRVQGQAQRFLSAQDSEKITTESFRAAMRGLAENCLQTQLDNPHMKIILFRELSSGLPYSRPLFDEVFLKVIEGVESFVKKAQEQGVVKKTIHPMSFLMMFVHTIDSYLMMCNSGARCSEKAFRLPEQKEEFLNHLLTVMLDGGVV